MVSLPPAREIAASLLVSNAISIGMTLFLKWFLFEWHDNGYPFATTMTFVHMVLKWLLATVLLKWRGPKNQAALASSSAPPTLSRRVYWTVVVPIAVCTSLNLLFSNLAFYYVTVTFSTVVKSTQNVWMLLFSVWFGHQKCTWPLVAVVVLVCSGVGLASFQSTLFDLRGFVFLLAAAMLGTLQWVLTQSLLKQLGGISSFHPVLTTVSITSPASAVCLLPIVVLYEGSGLMQSKFIRDRKLLLESSFWFLVGGIMASALIFSKVFLIQQTSALTMGISCSLRDVTLVLFAVVCFGDQLSVMNWLGLAAVVSGVFVYTLLKHRERPCATSATLEYPRNDEGKVGGADALAVETYAVVTGEPVPRNTPLSPHRRSSLSIVCLSAGPTTEIVPYHTMGCTPSKSNTSSMV